LHDTLIGPVVQYFIVSASIAVLALVFDMWRVLRHLDKSATAVVPAIEHQDTILNSIQSSIHDESAASREATRARK
jgi:uncharacterized membrane-anchored protein YhcB (DUF1043 family)